MTETSMYWDGITLGDATLSPYSAYEFSTVLANLLSGQNVSPWQFSHAPLGAAGLNSLLVSGVASPVSVAAGVANVVGHYYYNDASASITVPTPATNPRVDRIVLRASFAAQTVRAVRLAGAEAASPVPPALTQVNGTTWEVSLAQVEISTGGVIKVRDERIGFQTLAPAVLYRDISGRDFEEYFDNFYNGSIVTGQIGNTGWTSTLTGTGVVILNAAVPSAITLSSGATNGGQVVLSHGAVYPTEISKAPLLMEWRATPLNAAADAATIVVGRLNDAGSTNSVQFGVIGSTSTANLVARADLGGVATSVVTGTAIDTSGVFHKLGIWIPVSGGPAVFLYDGVPIASIPGANLPAATTDMRVEHVAANGATSATRATILDSSRLVRGA